MEEMGDKAVLSRVQESGAMEAVSLEGVGMDDLTITRRCAEAMGLSYEVVGDHVFVGPDGWNYDPIHVEEQAMALIKKLKLHIIWDATHEVWFAAPESVGPNFGRLDMRVGCNGHLNRAIGECVVRSYA